MGMEMERGIMTDHHPYRMTPLMGMEMEMGMEMGMGTLMGMKALIWMRTWNHH